MMAFAIDRPSQATGLARAIFEISIAASMQQALEEMQLAILKHCTRALTARLVLEIAGAPEAFSAFAHGGKLNS
jgi:hypothetical protein